MQTFIAPPTKITVPTPTVTPQGTVGVTTYTYKLVAVDANGGLSAAGTGGSTSTGNATLDGSNFNRLTWAALVGAAAILVYRTVGGATQGLIATLSGDATTVDDTGLAGDSATPPATMAFLSGAVDVSRLENLAWQLGGNGTATFQLQGTLDGVHWADIGSSAASDAVTAITGTWLRLRVKMTAYSSGTPTIVVLGHLTQG